ncbi:MAG: 30S ribosomal protein S5 alanine N-acetyltransferase, partial [Paracoccaceae bacterium]
MFLFKRKVQIVTDRLMLRLPLHRDYRSWSELRLNSKAFLTPWEPSWAADHLSRKSLANRVYWAQR